MTRLELVPGDPLLIAAGKVILRPIGLVRRAAPIAAPAVRSTVRMIRVGAASLARGVGALLRSTAVPVGRATLAAIEKADNGLASLAEGNPVMLNVFRVTAAIALVALMLMGLFLLA